MMKLKQILSLILSVCVLSTAVFVPTVVSADGSYSLADLLGTYKTATKWQYTSPDTAATSVTAAALTGSEAGSAYLGNTGDAIAIRLKVDSTKGGTEGATDGKVTIDATDNDSHRLNMTIGKTSVSAYTFDSGNYTQASKSIDLTDKWIELLIVNNGPGYDIYYKEDADTKYTEVFKTSSSRTETYAQRPTVWFSGNFYVDYIQRYEKDTTTLYSLENILGTDYRTLQTDSLNWTSTATSRALNGNAVSTYPLGGVGDAFEISFKAAGNNFNFNAYDKDGNYFKMQIQTLWEKDTYVMSGDTKYTVGDVKYDLVDKNMNILVVNKASGFEVYYKADDATGYALLVSTTQKGASGTQRNNVAIAMSGTGDYEVKSIKYYGKADSGGSDEGGSTAPTQPTVSVPVRRTDVIGATVSKSTWFASIDPRPMGSAGDAVELKLKVNMTVEGANDQLVDMQLHDADGTRVYFRIHEAGAWISNNSGVAAASAADGAKLVNQEVTLLFVNEATNYTVWYKTATDTLWSKLCQSTDKRSGGSDGRVSISPSSGTTVYVDYIKYYGAVSSYSSFSDNETVSGSFASIESEEFDGAIEGSYSVLGGSSTVTVSTDGLNLASGQKLFFDKAAIPLGGYADIRVKAGDGLSFRNGDGTAGNDINIELGKTENSSCYIVDHSTSGTLKTIFDGCVDDAPTEWHTYRIVRSATASTKYSVYHKGESDTNWTKVIKDADATGSKSVINGLTLGAVGDGALVDYFRIYTSYNPLTDADKIAAEKSKVWLFKDFSAADDSYTLNNMTVSGGQLNASKLASGTSGYAQFPLTSAELDGEWYWRFEHCLKEGSAAGSVVMNGKRLRWTFGATYSFIQTGTGNISPTISRELNTWYEYLIHFDGKGYANMYYRKVGDTAWSVIATSIALVDNSESYYIKYEAGSGGSYLVDNLRVYTGWLIDLSEPTAANGALSVSGTASVGHPYSTNDRRAAVIGATYNKEYGYTSFVDVKNYTVFIGKDADLTSRFDISAVDMTKNDAAVMVWDSTDTAVPLCAPTGSPTANAAKGRPDEGQLAGLSTETAYNEVYIKGLVDAGTTVSAALFDGTGKLCAVGQTDANQYGLIDMLVAVDPVVCHSGSYKLRLQYGGTRATDSTVTLNCADIMLTSPISDAATLKQFVLDYGSAEEKSLIATEGFADAAYTRFAALGAGSASGLYELRARLSKVITAEKTERELLSAVNAAVTEEKWSNLETLILTTYKEYLAECAADAGLTVSSVSGINNKKDLFDRMLDGGAYTSASDVITRFNAAVTAQRAAEGGGGGGGGGLSSGGNSSNNGKGDTTSITIADGKKDENSSSTSGTSAKPVGTPEEFADLDTVTWARESILKCRELGILSGDGDGKFHPERSITREEFLKLVMEALKLSTDTGGRLGFGDVDEDEWYFKYVRAAYKLGIINGVSEDSFGIGQKITRADMAVILKRATEVAGASLKAQTAAFVYDDFADMPDYSRESIFALSEAGLMNGMGDNCFKPLENATRAEAAVSIYRLYSYVNERG